MILLLFEYYIALLSILHENVQLMSQEYGKILSS